MPELVAIDDTGHVVSLSKLDGDTLTVHPAVFQRMQVACARPDLSPTAASVEAMKLAGLTDDEINSRVGRKTKIVVDASLATDFWKT